MKALVIGKPVYDYILPLVEFPSDGDNFFINESINTLSSFSTVISILLTKYGVETYFTGVVGEDDHARKIKEILSNNRVNIDCIETSYKEHTCISHKIYNQKTNTYTNILENSIKQGLVKYKYEFIPDVVIMDDSDYNANMAAINNYPNATLIYLGEKYKKESSVYCNKCKYVICSLKFASELTGVLNNLNKPKTIVSLFQKYLDMYGSNLIIKLDNFDLLYCVNDEVRIIKNVNKTLKNKDYLYYSILMYLLMFTNNIELSIKYTNKIMLNTTSDIDIIKNIPEFNSISEILNEIKNTINNNSTESSDSTKVNPVEVTKINVNQENNVTQNASANVINNNTNQVVTPNTNIIKEEKGDSNDK